jgi:hypothetical protein
MSFGLQTVAIMCEIDWDHVNKWSGGVLPRCVTVLYRPLQATAHHWLGTSLLVTLRTCMAKS